MTGMRLSMGCLKWGKITFPNRFQYDTFVEIWDKWKHYILSRHPEFV